MPTLVPVIDALQSFAFTRLGRTLADVGLQLAIVGGLLAVVCDSVPLIGDAFSFISGPLAPRELDLAPRDSLFALIHLCSAETEFTWHVGTVVHDHESTLTPRGPAAAAKSSTAESTADMRHSSQLQGFFALTAVDRKQV